MTTRFDAIVIGTGQSGPSLARRLTEAGRKVAWSSASASAAPASTTAASRPSRLIASARAAHVARRAADFGVVIEGAVRVDMKAVKARKDAIVRVSNEGVEEGLRENPTASPSTSAMRASSAPKQVAVGERDPRGRADLHQRRRPRRHPADRRHRDRAVSRQLLDDGGRLPAGAPGDPGRQLHRPRVRPDVPPLRQRGDDHPARPPAGPARGRGHRRRRSARSSRTRASGS